MLEEKAQIYRFDNFRLDVRNRELLCDGRRVTLPAKAFDMLVVLIESGGRLIEKDELFNRVWPDQIVEESNLTVHVSAIRKALGEQRENPHYIATVPGHGYRFIGDLVNIEDQEEETLIERRSISRFTIQSETPAAVEAAMIAATTPTDGKSSAVVRINHGERSIRSRAFNGRTVLVAGLAIILISAIALFFVRRMRSVGPVANPQIKSIAVLPFKPLVAGSRDELLEMGMAEVLILRLSSLREIRVSPTSAVRKYNGLEQDAVAAGRELQVEAVLDGNIQKAGNRLRVTVRLVRVSDSQTLWVERFDEDFNEVFAVQDRVSGKVIGSLAAKLSGQEQRLLAKRYTENTAAYESYLKGRFYFSKFTPADHRRAIEYFNQAIQTDPDYALAYTGLADTYAASATSSWIVPSEGYIRAKAATLKALQLDDNLAEAHTTLGAVSMFYDFDWATAEREYKRALELNPNHQTAYELYGYLLIATSRFDEGIEMTKRGVKVDPLSVLLIDDTGMAYYLARNYDEALKQYQTAIRLDANDAWAHLYSAMAYHQKGMNEDASAACQKAINVSERSSLNLAVLGYIYAAVGNRSEALKLLDELRQMSGQRYVSSYDLAILYTGLGDKDKALAQLNKAYIERSGWFINLKVDPLLDPLRSDPRFVDLVRRVELTPRKESL